MAEKTSKNTLAQVTSGLAVPDSHNPPPGYEAPIVCDGIDRHARRHGADARRQASLRRHLPAEHRRQVSRRCWRSRRTTRNIRRRNSPRPCNGRSRPGRACGLAAPKAAIPISWCDAATSTSAAIIRGTGKSDGGGSPEWDMYDLIEWIAKQPWCDGNVGMIGISAFGGAQFEAAAQQPPSLKAIFPYDPMGAYGAVGLSRFLSRRRDPHDGVPARLRRRLSRQSRPAGPAHRRQPTSSGARP